MLYREFALSEKYPDASLTAYVCDKSVTCKARPAVIVCPGGAYSIVAKRESEPIVRRFFGEGMNIYLLKYSVAPNARDYAPLIQASMAIKLVRERAEEDNTDPEKVFIIGFSAGGHVAASAGTLWNIGEVRDALGISDGSSAEGINRPDGMLLCYPVITGEAPFGHVGSLKNWSGHREPTQEDIDRFSIEKHVDAGTSPAFIWQTFTDGLPVENSLIMMNALAAAGVPFEAHIFPDGPHGAALCNAQTCEGMPHLVVPHAEVWSSLAVRWIRDLKR